MKAFHEYWTFSAIRGVLTMMAGVAIVALPQATSSILDIPVLITVAILCLATYSLFDGAVNVLLALLLPKEAKGGKMLYGQMAVDAVTGVLLFLTAYGTFDLAAVPWIVAAQAAAAAVTEWSVAKDAYRKLGRGSVFTNAALLAGCAFALPLASGLDADRMSLALAGYVGLYGAAQLALGGRMLFLEYRAEHPAAVFSQDWRMEMAPVATTLSAAMDAGCIACEECPADALCRDYSIAGQVAKIVADRQPFIVRTVRVMAVMETAGAHGGR